jgi:hypothetical protein
MRKSRALFVLATTALIVAGCGGTKNDASESNSAGPSQSTVSPSDNSDAQAPPDRLNIYVSITGDRVTPVNDQLHAAVGEQIIIKVSSDTADELHVHSNPEHTFEVKPGPPQTFQFTVAVPGRVDVELHEANKTVATIAVQ